MDLETVIVIHINDMISCTKFDLLCDNNIVQCTVHHLGEKESDRFLFE